MRYDLLATRNGRLAAFFLLYVTEGIPLGFTATAVATQMRRQGVGVEAIGAFVGALYLPWAFKWVMGPIVDTIASDRWGRRRGWILLTQVLMVGALLGAWPVDFAKQLPLFTGIVLLLNLFSATMDVSIDALAVNVLGEGERGLANGLMFGGAYLGQTIGGSGVLFLSPHLGFSNTYPIVAGTILAITLFVVLPMKERPDPTRAPSAGGSRAAGREIVQFVRDAFSAFIGTRGALLGVFFALLPAGAMALGLALQSNLAVELGLDDHQVGVLNLWTTVISAIGCVVGGWLSDRFGRRRMLAAYLLLMSVPTALLAWQMQQAGWIHSIDPSAPGRVAPSAVLVAQFWTASLVYAVFNGLMYGTRSALLMDVTTPRVAATQFTAYMALMNLAISYSARWQGWGLAHWGYPVTLAVDAAFGAVGVVLLPWIDAKKKTEAPPGARQEPVTIG